MITIRQLQTLKVRALGAPEAMQASLLCQLGVAMTRRTQERGPSKLARRLRRKQQLGMAGVF